MRRTYVALALIVLIAIGSMLWFLLRRTGPTNWDECLVEFGQPLCSAKRVVFQSRMPDDDSVFGAPVAHLQSISRADSAAPQEGTYVFVNSSTLRVYVEGVLTGEFVAPPDTPAFFSLDDRVLVHVVRIDGEGDVADYDYGKAVFFLINRATR